MDEDWIEGTEPCPECGGLLVLAVDRPERGDRLMRCIVCGEVHVAVATAGASNTSGRMTWGGTPLSLETASTCTAGTRAQPRTEE